MNPIDHTVSETKLKKNFIGKIAELFTRRVELTALVILLLISLGVASFFLLPKESLPEIVFPTLTVQTLYPGATPADVESYVTIPLENSLNQLDDVTDITSNSLYGFSFITVAFDESVDIDEKKIQLDNTLSGVVLPEGAFDPTSTQFKTSEIPLLSISLTGDYDLYTLTDYADQLASEINKVSGVEAVTLSGAVEQEVQVILDPDALEEAGLSASSVTSAIQNANVNFPLGDNAIDGTTYRVRIDQSYQSIDDLNNTLVTGPTSNLYTLEDLGTVSLASKDLSAYNRSYTRDSGLNNSVFISVIRKNKADVIGTSDAVKDLAQASIGTYLPDDLSAVVTNDTAINVRDDLSSIQNNALSGLLVVILVLFLFIGFRESLIVSLTIPLTLLTTLGLLGFFGITLNTFAVLGMIVALGLLVDNTIIVMENMDRLKKKGASALDAAVYGTNQVGLPITAATLTTVAAFFPLAILPGIIGAFINTIPRTIIIALVTSLVLAVIITPSVYYLVNKKVVKNEGQSSLLATIIQLAFVIGLSFFAFYGADLWIGIPIIATLFFTGAFILKLYFTRSKERGSAILGKYKNFIEGVTRSRLKMGLTLLIALGVLVSSVVLITSGLLKIAFFPETEPISVTLTVDAPAGTSLEETDLILKDIEDFLIQSDDVKRFNTTVGGNQVNTGTIIIDLEDNDRSGYDQLKAIRNDLRAITSAKISIQGNGAAGPPVGQPIEVKIVGDDLDSNLSLANTYLDRLNTIEGVYNSELSVTQGGNNLQLAIDEEKAAAYGLAPTYIAFSVNRLLSGETAITMSLDDTLTDVRVYTKGNTLDQFSDLSITSPLGMSVPLEDFMTLEESTGISGVIREDGIRTITLTADLENGYNAADVLDLFKSNVTDLTLPQGTSVLYEGESAGISDSFSNLFRSMIIAIFLVFMILTIQFGSIKQPLIIISTIPMAIIGVLYGLTITGNEFGFYAFMALVSLIGIAVNDAIVLIDYMNYLRKEGEDFYSAIGKATETRFNPVLATTLTTIGGILPLSFKNAYYAQFGYSLIFGLFITTLMTLIIIPVMYSLVEGRKERKGVKGKRKRRLATAFSTGLLK